MNASAAPPPTTGTSDQYEMGDLSGKFGTLEGRRRYFAAYNDTLLPLFGPRSIIGRSIVVHKKEKNARQVEHFNFQNHLSLNLLIISDGLVQQLNEAMLLRKPEN